MKRSDRLPILPQADLGYPSEHDPTTPARRLVIAMLTWAVADISRYARRRHRSPNSSPQQCELEAIAWAANKQATAPFSFRWCCDVLGLDVSKATAALKTLAQDARRSTECESGHDLRENEVRDGEEDRRQDAYNKRSPKANKDLFGQRKHLANVGL